MRIQRAASDRLGCLRIAGGKCRHQARNTSTRMDQREYRPNEGRLPAVWFQLRLAAGNLDLRARILPLEPMVFSADARARIGLPQTKPRQLVSGMQDGAGQ